MKGPIEFFKEFNALLIRPAGETVRDFDKRNAEASQTTGVFGGNFNSQTPTVFPFQFDAAVRDPPKTRFDARKNAEKITVRQAEFALDFDLVGRLTQDRGTFAGFAFSAVSRRPPVAKSLGCPHRVKWVCHVPPARRTHH